MQTHAFFWQHLLIKRWHSKRIKLFNVRPAYRKANNQSQMTVTVLNFTLISWSRYLLLQNEYALTLVHRQHCYLFVRQLQNLHDESRLTNINAQASAVTKQLKAHETIQRSFKYYNKTNTWNVFMQHWNICIRQLWVEDQIAITTIKTIETI